MKNLTLKQLRYFEALAQHGHFGRAAEASSISQPALSMQIKDLEAQLAAPLFERGASGLLLTPFGREFAAHARAVLREMGTLGDFVRHSAAQAAGGFGGRLALGVIPTIAPYFLPHMMQSLQAVHPALQVNLREAMTQVLLTELEAGRLDAALLALPIAAPHLVQWPLFSEDFVLVRPLSEAARPVPSPDALRQMRLLLLEEGHCFRDQALAFCAAPSGLGPRDVMDGSALTTLVQMVGAGLGVTLIPEMAVDLEARAAQVCIQRFAAPAPQRQIGLVWRKTSPLGGALAQIAVGLRPASAA